MKVTPIGTKHKLIPESSHDCDILDHCLRKANHNQIRSLFALKYILEKRRRTPFHTYIDIRDSNWKKNSQPPAWYWHNYFNLTTNEWLYVWKTSKNDPRFYLDSQEYTKKNEPRNEPFTQGRIRTKLTWRNNSETEGPRLGGTYQTHRDHNVRWQIQLKVKTAYFRHLQDYHLALPALIFRHVNGHIHYRKD